MSNSTEKTRLEEFRDELMKFNRRITQYKRISKGYPGAWILHEKIEQLIEAKESGPYKENKDVPSVENINELLRNSFSNWKGRTKRIDIIAKRIIDISEEKEFLDEFFSLGKGIQTNIMFEITTSLQFSPLFKEHLAKTFEFTIQPDDSFTNIYYPYLDIGEYKKVVPKEFRHYSPLFSIYTFANYLDYSIEENKDLELQKFGEILKSVTLNPKSNIGYSRLLLLNNQYIDKFLDTPVKDMMNVYEFVNKYSGFKIDQLEKYDSLVEELRNYAEGKSKIIHSGVKLYNYASSYSLFYRSLRDVLKGDYSPEDSLNLVAGITALTKESTDLLVRRGGKEIYSQINKNSNVILDKVIAPIIFLLDLQKAINYYQESNVRAAVGAFSLALIGLAITYLAIKLAIIVAVFIIIAWAIYYWNSKSDALNKIEGFLGYQFWGIKFWSNSIYVTSPGDIKFNLIYRDKKERLIEKIGRPNHNVFNQIGILNSIMLDFKVDNSVNWGSSGVIHYTQTHNITVKGSNISMSDILLTLKFYNKHGDNITSLFDLSTGRFNYGIEDPRFGEITEYKIPIFLDSDVTNIMTYRFPSWYNKPKWMRFESFKIDIEDEANQVSRFNRLLSIDLEMYLPKSANPKWDDDLFIALNGFPPDSKHRLEFLELELITTDLSEINSLNEFNRFNFKKIPSRFLSVTSLNW